MPALRSPILLAERASQRTNLLLRFCQDPHHVRRGDIELLAGRNLIEKKLRVVIGNDEAE